MPLGDGIPSDFHREFAAWVRIEPSARSGDLARGIAACTADALWMLSRQWLVAELDGEDAGSPIRADLRYSTQGLASLRLGEDGSVEAMPTAPLETVVEREPWPMDLWTRIQIGQESERLARELLREQADVVIRELRRAYPVTFPTDTELEKTDAATRRLLRFMEGRAIDGAELLTAARDGRLTSPTGVTEDEFAKLLDAVAGWWAALSSEPVSPASRAWRNEQLDYRFEVNAPEVGATDVGGDAGAQDRTHLIAPDYRSGALDWYSFESLSPPRGAWREEDAVSVYPTRIAIGGTSPRWWAFEDAATDFGALDVATPDLAKLLLMEFVLIYGDDWFSVPLTVNRPGLVRIDSLKIRNVFDQDGDELKLESVRKLTEGDWEVFTVTPRQPAEFGFVELNDYLLLPPVVGSRDESRPLEEVHMLRDEGANRIWGVEHTVLDGTGRPVRGFDAQRDRIAALIYDLKRYLKDPVLLAGQREGLEAALARAEGELASRTTDAVDVDGAPVYRLATTVPDNWIPFNPVATRFLGLGGPAVRLRRARMLRNAAAAEPEPIPARTRFLSLASANPLLGLEEATVPRGGLHLQLTAQRARWIDGKTFLWLGRKVVTGLGEGASGLRFDTVAEGSSTNHG